MTTGMQPQPKAGKRAKGREVIHTNKKRAECLSCVCVCVCVSMCNMCICQGSLLCACSAVSRVCINISGAHYHVVRSLIRAHLV